MFSPVFIWMTDTWQIKDLRAKKKTHISFFLQHLLPRQFQIFSPFVFLSLSNIIFVILFLLLVLIFNLSLYYQNIFFSLFMFCY